MFISKIFNIKKYFLKDWIATSYVGLPLAVCKLLSPVIYGGLSNFCVFTMPPGRGVGTLTQQCRFDSKRLNAISFQNEFGFVYPSQFYKHSARKYSSVWGCIATLLSTRGDSVAAISHGCGPPRWGSRNAAGLDAWSVILRGSRNCKHRHE